MRIALFGCTGELGREILTQGLANGHDFSVLVRRPDALQFPSESDRARVNVIQGDALNLDHVLATTTQAEVVVVSLGSRPNQPQICSLAQPLINQAISETPSVRRVIVVTSMGCGYSYTEAGIFVKFLVNTLLRSAIADKNVQEEAVQKHFVEGDTDYVIVRPGGLTSNPGVGTYVAQEHGTSGGMIARADVAKFILDECLDLTKFSRACIGIVAKK